MQVVSVETQRRNNEQPVFPLRSSRIRRADMKLTITQFCWIAIWEKEALEKAQASAPTGLVPQRWLRQGGQTSTVGRATIAQSSPDALTEASLRTSLFAGVVDNSTHGDFVTTSHAAGTNEADARNWLAESRVGAAIRSGAKAYSLIAVQTEVA